MSTYEKRMRQRLSARSLRSSELPSDAGYMKVALEEAELARGEREVPVGAVVVHSGEIIARTHNRTESGGSALLHAELEALRIALAGTDGARLTGCTLYVTLEPCPMCAGAILNARPDRVVFGARDPAAGALGSVIDLCGYPLGYRPCVTSGVLGEECSRLMREFFAGLRKNGEKAER